MERFRRPLHPDYMSTEEQLERLVDLLATGLVRCVIEESKMAPEEGVPLDGLGRSDVRSQPAQGGQLGSGEDVKSNEQRKE